MNSNTMNIKWYKMNCNECKQSATLHGIHCDTYKHFCKWSHRYRNSEILTQTQQRQLQETDTENLQPENICVPKLWRATCWILICEKCCHRNPTVRQQGRTLIPVCNIQEQQSEFFQSHNLNTNPAKQISKRISGKKDTQRFDANTTI